MATQNNEPDWLIELRQMVRPAWMKLIEDPGGAPVLAKKLRSNFSAELVAQYGTRQRQAWERFGLLYRSQQRWYDAILIYSAMYEHFIKLQLRSKNRIHKGMPLVWIADCYEALGYSCLAKRYLMLTLAEDAVTMSGNVDPIQTGSYPRLYSRHGLTDSEARSYVRKFYKLSQSNPVECQFPEWLLQEIDNKWQVEIPSPNETSIYNSNTLYVKELLANLGDGTGKTLERLGEYLLSCIPGCRTARRRRTGSTDYDIVCALEGPDVDFRSEFGRYFVCECKDWGSPVGFSSFAKFCRVLDSVKARFGIIFSRQGISGQGQTRYSQREQLKVFQDRGLVIVVFDQQDLGKASRGANMIALLRDKYERVRLDLVGAN